MHTLGQEKTLTDLSRESMVFTQSQIIYDTTKISLSETIMKEVSPYHNYPQALTRPYESLVKNDDSFYNETTIRNQRISIIPMRFQLILSSQKKEASSWIQIHESFSAED